MVVMVVQRMVVVVTVVVMVMVMELVVIVVVMVWRRGYGNRPLLSNLSHSSFLPFSPCARSAVRCDCAVLCK